MLIDFGTVKQITTQVVNALLQTNFTVAVGTLGYMPSEQANHNPRFSSDVYAVGIIGIQALTGVFPKDLPRDHHIGEIVWRKRAQVSQELAEILDTMVRYDFRQRYHSAGSYGIKIKYPQTWELQYINNAVTGEVIAFLSPKQSNADKFQEKLTITIDNFSGTLDEFRDSSIKDISNHLSQAKIVNTGATTLAYKSANQLVFTGKDGENSLKNLQVFTLRGDKAYVITYTAEIDNYDTFIQTAEKMVKSFEFK